MIKITLSLGSNYKSNSYSVLLCLSLPILFEEQDLRERRPNNKHFQVFYSLEHLPIYPVMDDSI